MSERREITPKSGFKDLNKMWDKLDAYEAELDKLSDSSYSFIHDPKERVLEKIRAFEPSVSIIGQVKAGKSTLVNAMVGKDNLLPSDVNPWTSVITGLHMNSRTRPMNTRALFRFFDQHEWDRLVATGGRLGEMSTRAGFETEADKVREQVMEMREATETRLGDEFNTLMGASHSYPDFDKNMVDRYICYGDPDDMEDGATEGVYADLTKSADLYIDDDTLPRGLCIRDTPGVNDTFMMREQITLNAISDSRVCVVVLSAHQALTNMDVALIRIICSVESRDVLIFVNRIDELENPQKAQDDIRASIAKTLQRLGVPSDIEVLFGSGHWANAAQHDLKSMQPGALKALEGMGVDVSDDDAVREAALQASGVPALHAAIAKRLAKGQGRAFLQDIEDEIDALKEMRDTVKNVVAYPGTARLPSTITMSQLKSKLYELQERALTKFDDNAFDLRTDLQKRLESAQETFVDSALEVLKSHIKTYGESGSWDHEPTALRMMMKSAFTRSVAKLRREGESSFELVFDEIQDLLHHELHAFREGISMDFPIQPQHKAPTVLARTLTVDMQGAWWRKFWKVGGTAKIEKRYRELITAETQKLIMDLMKEFFDPAVDATRAIVANFAKEQSAFCVAILEEMEKPEAASEEASA